MWKGAWIMLGKGTEDKAFRDKENSQVRIMDALKKDEFENWKNRCAIEGTKLSAIQMKDLENR